MAPVFPVIVSNPLVLPAQIVVPPAIDPPIDIGETITVVAAEFAMLQTPLVITALNCVV